MKINVEKNKIDIMDDDNNIGITFNEGAILRFYGSDTKLIIFDTTCENHEGFIFDASEVTELNTQSFSGNRDDLKSTMDTVFENGTGDTNPLPYKSWVGLVQGINGAAPATITIYNDLNIAVTLTHISDGQISLTLDNAILLNDDKTALFISGANGNEDFMLSAQRHDSSTIYINSKTIDPTVPNANIYADFYNAYFEIRRYN